MKKIALRLLLGFSSLAICSVAGAATLKGGYPVCQTEEDLDEFVQNAARVVQEGRCVMPKAGLDVVVLSGFLVLRIRLYTPSGKSVVVYTPTENVKR